NSASRTAVRRTNLVRFFYLYDTFVDGLAAGETFLQAVPVGNGFLAQFPAQQERIPFHYTVKIQQTDIQILHLRAGGIDFRQGIAHPLLRFDSLGSAARERNNVKVRAAVEKNAVVDRLQ